jgi:hypothetical protein
MTAVDDSDREERAENVEHSLYVSDRELRRRINPRLGWDRFRASVRDREKTRSPGGLVFPRLSASWGGRYWPGVDAYLADEEKGADHGAETRTAEANSDAAPHHAPPRKKARPQIHPPHRPALLGRDPGAQEPDGLSGSVHRLAARR